MPMVSLKLMAGAASDMVCPGSPGGFLCTELYFGFFSTSNLAVCVV